MRAASMTAALLCAALPLAACKIVPNPDPEEVAAANMSDEDRMAAWVDENWDARVLPAAEDNRTTWPAFSAALEEGLQPAGEAEGLRPSDNGPWFFFMQGEGQVVEANLDSRARRMELDMDGDGSADIALQLGPVVRGTALRDALPFVSFTDFRDQIEFAKLGRALNDRATANLPELSGDLTGSTVAFTGVFGLNSSAETPMAVPTSLEVRP
ncbi:hypothetical protein GCM10011415_19780 [Salipiger pallidus]|uniref:Lipoprotein n=1 Tax=Salipiger pallidus TaxID=1775170 RepID=A0A8J3EGM4_9RHOB|nr:DUF2291 domain-containing protein [Salipiger pallidus]GGG71870.1 hypothetical protein GCM10011415_19780 [Salipiger pallidus]